MSILYILLILVAVGVVLWLVNNYLPMESIVKRLLNIVVIVILALWLLKILGGWAALGSIRV